MSDYLIHFNPNHDPKTGRFTFKRSGDRTTKSEMKNYIKVMDSLSDEEFRLFTDGGEYDKKKETEWIKDYTKYQKSHTDSHVFVSKYGNVTMANLEPTNEWNIGWATNPKNRGTGITQKNIQEAITLVRKYSDLPITAIIEDDNIASQKTAEKAGFKNVGYTKLDNGDVRKKYVYN
jgi:RimJ/RimL family protein N-acetyltransferase